MKTIPIKLLLLFSLLTVIFSCEKDDTVINQRSYLKTVGLTDAKSFVRQSLEKKNSSSGDTFITSISDEINYEDLTNTDEELAVIPIKTIYKHLYSRITLLEIDGEVRSVVVSLNPFENATPSSFSGELLITDTEGKFLKGFKIENNLYVAEYVNAYKASNIDANKNHSITKSTVDCDTCPYSECSYCDLGSVDLGIIERTPPPSLYVSISHMYPTGGGVAETSSNEWDLGGSGPGYTDNTPEPEVQDEDPCDELLNQLSDDDYINRLNELVENAGSSTESGFAQNSGGSYTTLTATNNGHSLNGMGPNSVGFNHAHTNGTLFSPQDIRTFITLLANAHFNRQIPLDQIYGTVISNGEVYTIRYDGTWEDLDRNFDVSDRTYAEYISQSNSFLDGFLDLLQNNNSSNFRIFNLNTSNNTVKELTLDSSNNTTRSNPCN
jgi:hypothetical protein